MNLLKDFIKDYREYKDYDDMVQNFKLNIPEDFNFSYDVIDRYAELEPEKRALVWCDDEGDEKFFNFKDISRDTQRAAHFLSRHGIKKRDVVMLILRRRYEFWWLLPALHRIGAIAVPATNQLLKHDIIYRCNAADIKMIISFDDGNVMKQIEAALPESKSVQELVTVKGSREGWTDFHKEVDAYGEECNSFPRPQGEAATHNNDSMLMYFTSGTSGYPKMVAHDFTYPLGHITTAKFWQNVMDDGLHISVAETGWGKAVWGKLYGQWIAGTAVFVYDMVSFAPDLFFKKIAHYKVTTFCAPPTAYRFLIRQDLSKYDLSNLKYCVTAGEAMNSEVFNKFLEKTGIKIYEGYGQTESTVLAGTFPGMEVKPGSMGKSAPGYDVQIHNHDGKKCAPLECGSIVVNLKGGKPTGIFKGYYKNPEQTEKALSGEWYDTGDTAYYDDDGYIWFVGRNDDLIKSAGYRISPFEVESVLQQHPSVLECAVTGIKDPKRGQAVKATIVLTKEYKASKELEIELKTFATEHLALYKIPRLIEFVDELPKTISGKIRRVEIRQKDN
ncbi:AMP-binding protein [Treponema sp.]|uniref:AMP-binding protein n=1 Tax=Treponema sp. TaxID=166 RepID=UPI0025D48913|nr:AMP-binding protein [Treponema sp.]MCR5217810.1 AMP-binding protein [Treponema sp.]